LQLRQAPLHELSQQTPSTHWVEPHSLGSAQGTPFAFFPQVPVVVLFTVVDTHW
jgi:hypothetical protein